MAGYPIPPVFLLKYKNDDATIYDCIEGKQRLLNTFSFMSWEYALHGGTPDVELDGEVYEIAGRSFDELSDELKDIISGYRYSISVIEDATEEEMIEALEIACAWDFVKKRPDTINSNVGERGRGLSEGQAQRLSIARALLRDAPVLLLDEATSALDVETERRVLRNIMTQKPNKTCIVTTHRPSVLNMCRRVYRVMDTRVTELSEEEAAKMAMDF